IPGTAATLDSNTQLGLNVAYMVTDKIGVELLAATPFTQTVGLKGVDSALGAPAGTIDGSFAEVTHLPPTLSAVYYPLHGNAAFTPYLGAGLNFTVIFDEKLVIPQKHTGFKSISLDSSLGLEFQVGVDY